MTTFGVPEYVLMSDMFQSPHNNRATLTVLRGKVLHQMFGSKQVQQVVFSTPKRSSLRITELKLRNCTQPRCTRISCGRCLALAGFEQLCQAMPICLRPLEKFHVSDKHDIKASSGGRARQCGSLQEA
eukprot:38150-Amphidinium_carterae.1